MLLLRRHGRWSNHSTWPSGLSDMEAVGLAWLCRSSFEPRFFHFLLFLSSLSLNVLISSLHINNNTKFQDESVDNPTATKTPTIVCARRKAASATRRSLDGTKIKFCRRVAGATNLLCNKYERHFSASFVFMPYVRGFLYFGRQNWKMIQQFPSSSSSPKLFKPPF